MKALLGHCLTASLATIALGLLPAASIGQITPDTTLGPEASLVAPGTVGGNSTDVVAGGALRDSNLFHSFLEFNVAPNQQVYFANPLPVESILVRVTGNDASVIGGVLGVDGPADLFLINPDGIILGETSALDIAGSFYATTADAVALGNSLFSAVNPDSSELLSVTPSTVFFNYLDNNSATVTSAGNLQVGNNLVLAGGRLRLSGPISTGGDLTLVGGNDVIVEDNAYYSAGGSFLIKRPTGFRGVLNTRNNPSNQLNNTVIHAAGDVDFRRYIGGSLQILSGGQVFIRDVNLYGAGSDPIDGPATVLSLSDPQFRLLLSPEERPIIDIRSGVTPASLGFDSVDPSTRTDAGINIRQTTVRAADALVFFTNQYESDPSLDAGAIQVRSITGDENTRFRFTGDGADIVFDARGDVKIMGGEVQTSSGQQPGEVIILAEGETFLQGNLSDRRNFFGIEALNRGSREPADIYIKTGSLLITESARIAVDTLGRGDAGTLTVIADGDVTLEDSRARTFEGPREESHSGLSNWIGTTTKNPAAPVSSGGISVQAENIILRAGAQIQVRVRDNAWGNSGDLRLNANNALLMEEGQVADGRQRGGAIINSVENNSRGQAGDIYIQADTVNGIGGSIQSNTRGRGNGGLVEIVADDAITLDGLFILTRVNPASRVETGGIGNAGTVSLTAPTIRLINGGRVRSNTENRGNAGTVTINAEELLEIRDACDFFAGCASSITTQVNRTSTEGDGGAINIQAGRLVLTDSGFLDATTQGAGDAGQINVVVDQLQMDGGSRITTTTQSQANAGQINVTVHQDADIAGQSFISSSADNNATGDSGTVSINVNNQLRVRDNAEIVARNRGTGTGGSIVLISDDLVVTNQGGIDATTESSGTAGQVDIVTNRLRVDTQGRISSVTNGAAKAGRIGIVVNGTAELDTQGNITSGAGLGATGDGGDVVVAVQDQLTLRNDSQIAVNNRGSGQGGSLRVEAMNLLMESGAELSADTVSNRGGDIDLVVPGLILLRSGSQISTTAGNNLAGGDGGNISVKTDFLIAVPEENSDISANAFSGNGGQVNIEAQGLFGIEPRSQPTPLSDITASSQLGVTGTVDIFTLNTDLLQNSLNELPDNLINTETLVASSCIAPVAEGSGRLVVTGGDGVPLQPGNTGITTVDTGGIRALPTEDEVALSDDGEGRIVEPQLLYQLADGRMVLSRNCS